MHNGMRKIVHSEVVIELNGGALIPCSVYMRLPICGQLNICA